MELRKMKHLTPFSSAKNRRLFRILLALSFLSLFSGCGEPQADLSAPKTHRSGAITFDYPKNWKITEDSVEPEMHYLFVESPGDAIATFQSFPIDESRSLTDFAKEFTESAKTEMPLLKVAKSTFTDVPEVSGYEWIAEEFDVSLLTESIPYRRLYGTKEIDDRQVFLIFQITKEDFAKAEPGFDLIRDSLRGTGRAKQAGAGQSASLPQSKPEGIQKLQPESEGRSR